MKTLLAITALFFCSLCFSQNNDTIIIIAKRITPVACDKMCVAKYSLLKTIQGAVSSTIIEIGALPGKTMANAPETALLKIMPTKLKDYYIFPEFDQNKGVEDSAILHIDRAYWEACESGSSFCKPLTLTRNPAAKDCYIITPCGGMETTIKLTDATGKRIKELHFDYAQCPPVVDLKGLTDGKYFVTVISAGLGGKAEINLVTK